MSSFPAYNVNKVYKELKYRNPEKPEETWAGRGRKPFWLAAQLKKRGVTIKDFAI